MNKDAECEFTSAEEGWLCLYTDNFKNYFITHDMVSQLEKLRAGLDSESLKVIDRDLDMYLNYPGKAWGKVFFFKTHEDCFTPEEKQKRDWEHQELLRFASEHPGMPESCLLVESSVYAHGLGDPDFPQRALNYIKGKIFVDGGAGCGDSAFALLEYEPRKIYSFEMNPSMLEKLRSNAAFFDKADLVEIVPMALFSGSRHFCCGGNSIFNPGGNEVESISLDALFDAHPGETLGFLKADIEGAEKDMLQGAKRVISRDRPVLSISMYHEAEHYFEMKPMLESWKLGYKFRIRRHARRVIPSESSLIAYPEELES